MNQYYIVTIYYYNVVKFPNLILYFLKLPQIICNIPIVKQRRYEDGKSWSNIRTDTEI